MEKKYGNDMSVMGYYFKNMIRYWRKTFKMMFLYNRSEWSEITRSWLASLSEYKFNHEFVITSKI